jgi:outer membrane protein OmpA-like peptidoglycan-associated protein
MTLNTRKKQTAFRVLSLSEKESCMIPNFAAAAFVPLWAFLAVQAQTPSEQPDSMPIYRVTAVSRTLSAINYQHRSGPTKIDFKGTILLPSAHGEATVESKKGRIEIDARFERIEAPQRFGREYLTYVLWAVSPEGRAMNLAEIVPGTSDKADIRVTTDLQTFGLIVTAEPYFAVSRPSDVVVMENQVRPDTIGKVEQVSAKTELMPRGQYTFDVPPARARSEDAGARKVSMDQYEALLALYQAQNAVQIAQSLGAARYAAETYNKASELLGQAQDMQSRKMNMRTVVTTAREAAQTAEDARAITIKRLDNERLAKDQREVAVAETQTEQAESRLAAARAQEDSERIAKEHAQAEAARANQLMRQEASQARADRVTGAAQAAVNQTASVRQETPSQQALRIRLLRDLAPILDARDSPRGLLVTVPDSAFRAPAALGSGALDGLSRIASIVRAHPGLHLEVDGHTDSVGGDAYDQRLSEQRAAAVRDALVGAGIPPNAIIARGFGKTHPLESNETAAGRARNRRVEVVISGDPIGPMASWDQTYTLRPQR